MSIFVSCYIAFCATKFYAGNIVYNNASLNNEIWRTEVITETEFPTSPTVRPPGMCPHISIDWLIIVFNFVFRLSTFIQWKWATTRLNPKILIWLINKKYFYRDWGKKSRTEFLFFSFSWMKQELEFFSWFIKLKKI